MKTLEEIKDQYAIERGYTDWKDYVEYKGIILDETLDDICNLFSIEVAKEALKNASEKGLKKFIGQGYLLHDELKEEIENENNIPKL